MNSRFLNAVLIGSIIHVAALTTSATTRWSRVAPHGAVFSIEAPGEAH
jgi:hypothetical protein